MENQHTTLLKESLLNNSHLVMALPTFSRDSNPPTVAHLLGNYPSPASRTNSMGGSSAAAAVETSNIDVSNMLVNHDVQYQMWQKQQQQQMAIGSNQTWGPGDSTIAPVQMSVDDAFGDMPEVEDRPLPSLQYTVPDEETSDQVVENQVDDDDFGDFGEAQNDEPQEHPNMEAGGNENEFGGFEDGTASFQQYNSDTFNQSEDIPSTSAPGIGATVSPDEFDSDAAPKNVQKATGESYGLELQDDFAGFESTSNEPTFTGQQDDEFGGFESTDAQSEIPGAAIVKSEYNDDPNAASQYQDETLHIDNNFSQAYDHGPTLSISDAFEGMVADQDEFGGFESTNAAMVEISEKEVSNQEDVTGEDDEFEGTGSELEANDMIGFKSLDNNQTETTIAESFPQSNQVPTLSISDAFDSLIPDQEIPTVPFGSQLGDNNITTQNNLGHEDAGFGEFTSKDQVQPEVDALHSTNIPDEDDTFGDFEGDFESSVPEHNVNYNEATNNVVETVPPETAESEDQIRNPQLGNHAPRLSISDAFESFVPDHTVSETQDTPDNDPTSQPNISEPDEIQNKVSFGSIDHVDSTEVSIIDEKKTNDDSNPSTDTFNQMPSQIDRPPDLAFENGFNASTIGDNDNLESGGLSAFDVFGDIQDAPLPPLEAFSPTVDQEVKNIAAGDECDESFRDFEDNANIEECSPGAAVENNVEPTDDEFGAFSGEAQNAQSHEVAGEEFDESFGDFEGNTKVEECSPVASAVENNIEPTDDEFGAFSGDAHTIDAQLHVVADEFDGSFGDFSESSAVAEQYIASKDTTTVKSTDFGNTRGRTLEIIPPFRTETSEVGGFAGFSNDVQEPSSVNESFGDFGEVSAGDLTGQETNCKASDSVDAPTDLRGFSAFEEMPPQADPLSEQLNKTKAESPPTEEEFASFDEAAPAAFDSPFEASAQVDGFSAFDSVDATHADTNIETGAILNTEDGAGEDNFGDFAAFGSANIEGIKDSHIPDERAHDITGFADFGPANEPPPTDVAEQAVEALAAPDDFGGFGSAPTERFDTTTPEAADEIPAEDDGFGDFSAFDSGTTEEEQIQEIQSGTALDQQNDGVNPDTPTEGFDATTLETAQETPSEDDGFGDFAAFDSGTTDEEQTQDIQLDKLDQQNDGTKAEDDFGDFDFAEFDSAPPPPANDTTTTPSRPHDDLRTRICAINQFPSSLPSKHIIIDCFDRCANKEVSIKSFLLDEHFTNGARSPYFLPCLLSLPAIISVRASL